MQKELHAHVNFPFLFAGCTIWLRQAMRYELSAPSIWPLTSVLQINFTLFMISEKDSVTMGHFN